MRDGLSPPGRAPFRAGAPLVGRRLAGTVSDVARTQIDRPAVSSSQAMNACLKDTVPLPTKTSFGSRDFHASNLDERLPIRDQRLALCSFEPVFSLPRRPGRLAGGESFPGPGPGPGSAPGPDQVRLNARSRGHE